MRKTSCRIRGWKYLFLRCVTRHVKLIHKANLENVLLHVRLFLGMLQVAIISVPSYASGRAICDSPGNNPVRCEQKGFSDISRRFCSYL